MALGLVRRSTKRVTLLLVMCTCGVFIPLYVLNFAELLKSPRDERAAILSESGSEVTSYSEAEERMNDRIARVQSVCDKHPELREAFSNNSIIARNHSLFYCPVPKVASTFWSRVFYQLLYSDPVRSPFQVPVTSVLPSSFYKFKLHLDPQQLNYTVISDTVSEYVRLIYVRDPFSRIFSAYVDKLLAPNPHFWLAWGFPAIRHFRNESNSRRRRQHCYHDATFAEFVDLTIKEIWNKDVHVEPISQRCSPCMFEFNVIGKMETFYKDAVHLLALLNISESQMEFEKLEEETAADAIDDSIKDSLSKNWLQLSLQCVSKDAVLRRILRKLQIRGLVSWRFKYPFSLQDVKNVTYSSYKTMLTKARVAFFNKTELSIQKKQAFFEAFGSVTNEQFQKIWELYTVDLQMFGVTKLLSAVKNVNSLVMIHTNAFDWSKDWDLSPVIGSN